MTDPIDMLAGRLGGRVHRDESGAITLAALAACLILIMVGLTIWDAGRSARDKIDVQNAADTAAYSQAAVRARSMNMLAFTNVAKRSVAGMHSMYFGMWTAYAMWWAQECRNAASFDPDATANCRRNTPVGMTEGGDDGDWERLVGEPHDRGGSKFHAAQNIGGQLFAEWLTEDDGLTYYVFGSELMALDDYQQYLVEVTPWWAWTEGLVRSTRNGAHISASFPIPGELQGGGNGWIRQALSGSNSPYSFGRNSDNSEAAAMYDFDVRQTDGNPRDTDLLSRPQQRGIFTPLSFGSPRDRRQAQEACLPTGLMQQAAQNVGAGGQYNNPTGLGPRGPVTPPLVNLITGDLRVHQRRSAVDADEEEILAAGLALAAETAPPFAPFSSTQLPAGGGCSWTLRLFQRDTRTPSGNFQDRSTAIPYLLAANGNSGADLMARSNIVFAYRHTPDRALQISNSGRVHSGGRETSKRNIIGLDYQVENADNPLYRTRGYWSVARAEIVFPWRRAGRSDPNSQGGNGLWMWRPGWTAKMRPLALPGEWNDPSLNFDLNAAFHATDRFFLLAEDIGVLNNNDSDLNAVSDMAPDLQFMEKATRTLDSRAIEGAIK